MIAERLLHELEARTTVGEELLDCIRTLVASDEYGKQLVQHAAGQVSEIPTLPDGANPDFAFVLHLIHNPTPEVEHFFAGVPFGSRMLAVLRRLTPESSIEAEELSVFRDAIYVSGDGTIYGFAKYEQLDPGWFWALANYLENKLDPSSVHEFVAAGPTNSFFDAQGDPTTIAIIGDWGTGFYDDGGSDGCAAKRVADGVRALSYDHLVHLGDVYYAGTDKRHPQHEELQNFVEVWPDSVPGRSFTLNSNHEMYGAAKGLFDVTLKAPAFSGQDGSSVWARRTTASQGPGWLVIGLDSAMFSDDYYGCHMYMEGAIGSAKCQQQIEWLKGFRSEEASILVLSHHNPCETETGVVNDLFNQVVDALGREPELWYWGHVHNGIVYNAMHRTEGGEAVLTGGRCAGHGAIPFGKGEALEALQSSGGVAYFAQTADPTYPPESKRVRNGFAVVDLHADGSASERFYEVGESLAVWESPRKEPKG